MDRPANDDSIRTPAGEERPGDIDAFTRLVQRYHPELSAFAMRRIGVAEDVDDLLQDVFLSIWRHPELLHTGESVRAYLYRAVRNSIINHRRDRSRSARIFDDQADLTIVSTPESDSSTTLEQQEILRAIEQAVAALPERCREVWILVRERELTYAEAADVLGIAVGTVRVQMARAFHAIRTAVTSLLTTMLITQLF